MDHSGYPTGHIVIPQLQPHSRGNIDEPQRDQNPNLSHSEPKIYLLVEQKREHGKGCKQKTIGKNRGSAQPDSHQG